MDPLSPISGMTEAAPPNEVPGQSERALQPALPGFEDLVVDSRSLEDLAVDNRSIVARLMSLMRLNPGASDEAIQQAQASLGIVLPEDYVAVMKEANGGDGVIGECYLSLDPIEELVPRNARLRSAEFAPGIVVFGSNGGLAAYALDMTSSPLSVVEMDFIGDYRREVAKTFTAFLETLHG
jgi:hypothetical protein